MPVRLRQELQALPWGAGIVALSCGIREGFSDHWSGRVARSRRNGLSFRRPLDPHDFALGRWFASLRFWRRAHASHLAVISAIDLANGQRRGLGFAHHLE